MNYLMFGWSFHPEKTVRGELEYVLKVFSDKKQEYVKY